MKGKQKERLQKDSILEAAKKREGKA